MWITLYIYFVFRSVENSSANYFFSLRSANFNYEKKKVQKYFSSRATTNIRIFGSAIWSGSQL